MHGHVRSSAGAVLPGCCGPQHSFTTRAVPHLPVTPFLYERHSEYPSSAVRWCERSAGVRVTVREPWCVLSARNGQRAPAAVCVMARGIGLKEAARAEGNGR